MNILADNYYDFNVVAGIVPDSKAASAASEKPVPSPDTKPTKKIAKTEGVAFRS